MQVGDVVIKTKGYHFEGVVVAVFQKLNGDTRYVVECTVPGAGGLLHIFNKDQFRSKKIVEAMERLANR